MAFNDLQIPLVDQTGNSAGRLSGLTIDASGAVTGATASLAVTELTVTTLNVTTIVPATPANVPLTTPDVQDVIDALIALGLVEQSDPA